MTAQNLHLKQLCYSWFLEKGSFSVHSYNEDYPSIPGDTGSWGNHFQEFPVGSVNNLHSIMKITAACSWNQLYANYGSWSRLRYAKQTVFITFFSLLSISWCKTGFYYYFFSQKVLIVEIVYIYSSYSWLFK